MSDAESPLELLRNALQEMVDEAKKRIADHLESLPDQPAEATGGVERVVDALDEPMPREPTRYDEVLDPLFDEAIQRSVTNWRHSPIPATNTISGSTPTPPSETNSRPSRPVHSHRTEGDNGLFSTTIALRPKNLVAYFTIRTRRASGPRSKYSQSKTSKTFGCRSFGSIS